MDTQEIQEKIDRLHYWDSRAKLLLNEYFSDEVTLVYESSEGNVCYKFLECYKVHFDHCLTYKKFAPSSQLTRGQIPYFLQDVTVGKIEEDDISLYTFKINMFPLDIEIWCKDITISVLDERV